MNRPIAIVESSAELGGAELSLLPVAAELVQSRRVVAFLPARGALESSLSRLGVDLRGDFMLPTTLASATGSYGMRRAPRVIWSAVAQHVRLTAALRRLNPSIVYCNGFRAQVAATIPARLVGAEVVWHVRDFARPGVLGHLWARLAGAARLIIANSSATARQPALARQASRVHAELNGINRELFRPRSAEPEGAPVLGMAGHLTPWKGHLRFVRLLAGLRAEVPDLLGRIAGAPIYDTGAHATFGDRLQESITRHQLDDYCRLDPLAPEEMPGWLAGLTVLAHCPDRPEPFGRVLAEALAVGVPVVSASEGGPGEILGDAGILLPLGDDRGLHDAVLTLLRDRSARTHLAEAGVVRAARHFDERGYAARVARRILAVA